MTIKFRGLTPKQEAALRRGTRIRTLCMIYAVAGHPPFTVAETNAIRKIADDALIRERGESETAKRERERAEYEKDV